VPAFPKTERGLRSRITRYRAELNREKRAHGNISDGAGTRYVIFWLLFLLNDHKESKKYIKWYEKEFDGDIGEPIHKLCLALMLHRMGDTREAAYALADLMLTNQHFVPALTGIPGPRRKRARRNYDGASFVEEIPSEILAAITEPEKAWMREKYRSATFQRLRKRHVEIETELDKAEVGPRRSKLVRELFGLLEKYRTEITANKMLESDA